MRNNIFIKEALIQAKIAYDNNEIPVGAVIAKDNKIISKAHNNVKSTNDPMGHAEIIAIKKACKILQQDKLRNTSIYITLEPCLMCTSLIYLTQIENIYYSIADKKYGAIESNPPNITKSAYYRPNIYSNIGEYESKNLLSDFFKNKR